MPASTTAQLEQLRLLTDLLPSGIVALDSQLRIAYANLAAKRLVHPVRLTIGDQLPDRCGSLSMRTFAKRLFDADATSRREEVHLAEDRMLRFTGLRSRDRMTVGLLIEDVSERMRRERAQREFVANAAHELLTPLTGITGAAHVLQAGAKDDPESRDRFLEHIARECNRMARIARALLVLARTRSGEEPPRPELVELRLLFADVVDAVGGADLVSLDCPDSLTAFVDRDLVEAALTNLVANAVRHSAGVPVEVSVRSGSGSGPVGIEIRDSGPGLSDEQVARVRRRFSSGEGRDGGGFGLGVSIASQALEIIGGTLSFESPSSGGALVRVELPSGHAYG